ncbi:MAG: SDR family NAD(P)-dependent oxidoreductase [Gammaproteobacteria bacterium]|nr:SDR family NAD(P)-dependent oxidoreductase [Gammaproteobacteria bacterium]
MYALVTGGNRGIGLEVCRQLARKGLSVILAARDPALGRQAAARLAREGLRLRVERLDVASHASVRRCAQRLARDRIPVSVLVNNAGVYERAGLLRLDDAAFLRSLDTNLLGAFRTARAFLPGMNRRGYGRIVNVGSGYGAFSRGLEGPPAYAVSKAALDALTVKTAQAAGRNVKVNAADPGWVRTRMGGRRAELSVEQGADTIVWLATLPDDGPSGRLFRAREPAPW